MGTPSWGNFLFIAWNTLIPHLHSLGFGKTGKTQRHGFLEEKNLKPIPRHLSSYSQMMSVWGVLHHRNETHRSFRFQKTILSFGDPLLVGVCFFFQ